MENNVNKNVREESINTHKKKQEIAKAMPGISVFIIGIVVGIIIWYGIYDFWLAIEKENDYYFDYGHLLTASIIIGIIVLISILLSCIRILGVIAKNQVDLMEHLGCTNSNQQLVETDPVEIKEVDKVAKLKELRDSGIISQDDFAAQISKLQ